MGIIATYDGKIFHNPSNKFCIVIVKTADTSVPEQARDKRRYGDHLIRFTAVGYEIQIPSKCHASFCSIGTACAVLSSKKAAF